MNSDLLIVILITAALVLVICTVCLVYTHNEKKREERLAEMPKTDSDSNINATLATKWAMRTRGKI